MNKLSKQIFCTTVLCLLAFYLLDSDGRGLPTVRTGAAEFQRDLEQSLARPLALASADFDEDGVPEFIGGYAGPGGSPTPTPTPCSRIAFDSTRDGNYEIYVMNADGTNQTRLTNNTANDARASISPDGSKIAFGSDRNGNYEIYVMNADGTNQTRLTNNPADDYIPNFSPDGSKIVFESKRDGVNEELYVMNADGSGQTRLTNNPARDGNPAFSADGSKIAFESFRDGNEEIYVMNADGTNQTRLTNNPADDGDPFFSPDGSKIAFETKRDGDFWEIYVMNADGTGQVNLTNNPAHDTDPFFSPDGSKIAFETTRDGLYEIYVMNADGTGPTNLTNNPENDFSPSWTGCQASPGPTCVPSPVGMVSWWPGDGNANDIQGNNGTLQNGATFAPGMVGQAFSFDGADDFVNVPDANSLTLGAAPFTIDLWVKFNQINGRDPFISHDEAGGEQNKWIFWFDNIGHGIPGPALRFHINSSIIGPMDPVIASWSPNTGQWYHVAVTRDGSMYALYINGVQVATATNSLTIPNPAAPLTIGRAEGFFLNGLTDEVDIFNRALSASEIQAIYNAGSAGKCKAACAITCLPSQTVNTGPGAMQCGTTVNYPAPTTTGSCGTVSCSPASSSSFPVGTTAITCTTDAGPSCSFTVTVIDDTPPTITCPANITTTTAPGQCSAVVNYTTTATDNCAGVTVVSSPPSGSAFPKGTTTVTCTATDAAGNTATCTFTVTINDAEQPMITCPPNQTVPATSPGGAVVNYPPPTVTDNCQGATSVCSPLSGSTFPIGTTTVTCTATDTANNVTNCTFTVIVTSNPTISINDVSVTEGDSGTANAVFTVSLSVASSRTITVNFAAANDTATAGSDYVANSGTLTFNPNETTRPITVVVNGDTTSEPDETFFVNLSNPVNAMIADGQGIGTIVNDDPSSCVTAQPNLVSWWPGDGNANDIQDGNNGTLENGATFAPGIVEQAFSFDGVDDVVTVPNAPSLNFDPNSPITVELWAYRTGSASVMHFIGKRTGCGFNDFNYQMAFDPTRGLLFGGDPINGPVTTGQQMPLNTWAHLAGTFDGTTLRFYINGALAGTSNGTLGPINDAPLEIGNSGTCTPFEGLIDEVSLYNRALSSSEIQAIYNAGSAGKCKMVEPVFSVSCSPSSLSLAQGSGGTTTCTVTSLNGFSSAVALSCSGQPAGVTCSFNPNPVTPPANGSITSTLTVNVASNASPGSYTLQVVGTAGNLTQTFDLQLTVISHSADLWVSKTGSPDPVARGSNITYTVVVANNGPSDATDVSLSDPVPTDTKFVSNSGAAGWSCANPPTKGAGAGIGTIICTTSGLASGISATFTIVVQVKPGTPGGTVITNTATASSSTSDPNTSNNSATATTTVIRR